MTGSSRIRRASSCRPTSFDHAATYQALRMNGAMKISCCSGLEDIAQEACRERRSQRAVSRDLRAARLHQLVGAKIRVHGIVDRQARLDDRRVALMQQQVAL